MKRNPILCLLSLIGAIGSVQAATITYTFTNNTGADFSSYTGTSVPITIEDIAVVADGVTFTFDLTLDATFNDGTSGVVFSTQRVRFNGGTTGTDNTKTALFTISDVTLTSPGSVDSWKFVTVDRFDNNGGDNWLVNGETISATGNTVDLTTGQGASLSLEAIDNSPDANGNSRLEGFQIEFVTTVPEPSSAALLGLGATALLVRRRK
ncbi:PEP-CTERM sorting domain-containing protein [Verrucomicrobiaceae bacterium N1E253]|uniref:PEP-CTERM sorting domain-containing protein n=1 Tax=Oceaniferula marina TaxID=2748318 RepID=A0A851GF74_9BACT|nr:PEP-CTERM sorting domain-containing protein [Oceaniferula marina]NWK55849.1 PEP-CTERM sorting domain-containing protein [Oceaniferula marina]